MLGVIISLGVLTVISAAGVVFAKRTLNSALWLILTLLLIAIHFALLGAEFLAVLQVLLYAGAIMVLVVFVIMLLGVEQPPEKPSSKVAPAFAFICCSILAGATTFAFSKGTAGELITKKAPLVGGTAKDLGLLLFTEYFYPMQLGALILLVAIVGAVVLSYQERPPLCGGRGLRAVRVPRLKVRDEEDAE